MVLVDYYDSNASKIGDEDVNRDDHENIDKSGSTPSGSTPSEPETPSTGQRMDTLKLNINTLTRTSWLHDCHIEIAIENIRMYKVNNNECTPKQLWKLN